MNEAVADEDYSEVRGSPAEARDVGGDEEHWRTKEAESTYRTGMSVKPADLLEYVMRTLCSKRRSCPALSLHSRAVRMTLSNKKLGKLMLRFGKCEALRTSRQSGR